jgi:class 3 adenylate cyclase
VTLAAHLKDAAGHGEVVVSSTVRDLVAGSGLRFSERATLQLEGVQGEWRLYALDA